MNMLIVIFCVVVLFFGASLQLEPCVVKLDSTSYGVGILNSTFSGVSHCVYLGVRYAEAPIGRLRFKNPVLHVPSGAQNYTVVGNICTQENHFHSPTDIIGDEDCLFLNIYSPLVAIDAGQNVKYQVLVFVHGGTFAVGHSLVDTGSGVDLLVESGILVVTINYRLGPHGFLRYPELNITGNYGIKDQREALRWVQRYVKFFGGDPQRVTLMGQSAGAGAVTALLYAESARGLFQQLIAIGGSTLAPWARNYNFGSFAEKLASNLNVTSLEQFQEVDSKLLFNITYNFIGYFTMFYGVFLPTVEEDDEPDALLTGLPHKNVLNKPVNQVPILMGQTATEFELLLFYADFLYMGDNYPNNENETIKTNIAKFIAYAEQYLEDPEFYKKFANMANMCYPIKKFLKQLSKQLDTNPIYYYRFEFDGRFGYYKNGYYKSRTNGSRYGAVHGDDLGYIFTPYVVKAALQNRSEYRREWKVHERTVELLSNFVKYGNPTPKESKLSNIVWPAYNENATRPVYLNIDETFEIRQDDDVDNRFYNMWDKIYHCLYYYECDSFNYEWGDSENDEIDNTINNE
ncbi:esterase E4-like [Toxorhynchites rutilus septentrionalis]|uniref:esterase E4-like n=1 Tax=Toxorhynchites rutilus septentrionalis TaxID=329112 RepID=UPI00247B0444|nr:esterase E4-like [Toxorhynchites rutilus septentrionalis]